MSRHAHWPAKLLVHQYRRIDAVHVIAIFDKHAPPQVHNIALERHAERTVIPRAAEAPYTSLPW